MKSLKVAIVLTLCCVALAGIADNLVKDAEFQEVDFSPKAIRTSTWVTYIIEMPSETTLDKDKKAVTMKGGKTFLHSSKFDVEAGKKYEISFKADGKGTVSAETLWWDKDGGMANPHRGIPIKPTQVDGSQELKGTDTAPKDAATCYIRLVVEKGTVTCSAPNVTKVD